MKTWTFIDHYNMKQGRKGTVKIVHVRAESEQEAWAVFANKWAIGNFGLKRNSTPDEVKEHFGDTVTVIGPDETLELEQMYR